MSQILFAEAFQMNLTSRFDVAFKLHGLFVALNPDRNLPTQLCRLALCWAVTFVQGHK